MIGECKKFFPSLCDSGVVKKIEHRLRETWMVKIAGPRMRQLGQRQPNYGITQPSRMYPGNLAFV